MYSGASNMVITCAGDSRSFELKAGLHQGSVPSPLLFIIVMDVVMIEGGEKLMYADHLILMVPSVAM